MHKKINKGSIKFVTHLNTCMEPLSEAEAIDWVESQKVNVFI